LLIKKGDPGRPVIPISIRSVNFNEAICDFGASINIMPKVIYDKMFNYPFIVYNHVLIACGPVTLLQQRDPRRYLCMSR
jgi:hypothetical protein